MATISLYPLSMKEELRKLFVGKNLRDVATPAAVLDISKLKQNCDRMLEATEELKFGWRAHIKTHKTTELTRLQVGKGKGPANIIVSTLIEAEYVVPLLVELKAAGRVVNVCLLLLIKNPAKLPQLLYSFPITPAAVKRLALISTALGADGLSLMVDHPDQLPSIAHLHSKTSIAPQIFLKINMGSNRAGVVPQTEACTTLISSILSLEKSGHCSLLGLYSHAGHSYSSSSSSDALDFLRQEFEALLVTASTVHSLSSPTKPLVLSVGATPTTTSVRNLLLPSPSTSTSPPETLAISALKTTLATILSLSCAIEIHAGVYPTLDIQQLATHALPNTSLSFKNIAFTILAEIASLYPSRGRSGTAEALIGAGSLALGREPCKAYPGFAMLTPWNRPGVEMPDCPSEEHVGWQVGRISQEHGILTWGGPGADGKEAEKLEVGMKVRVWPNHACIAGAGFGWYVIVDETREGKEDEIIDVWPRWRGW